MHSLRSMIKLNQILAIHQAVLLYQIMSKLKKITKFILYLFIVIAYCRLFSPDRGFQRGSNINDSIDLNHDIITSSQISSSEPQLVLYVPEVEEIRISPVISRKGYLNILEHKTNGWKKRWVVNVFIYYLGIIM